MRNRIAWVLVAIVCVVAALGTNTAVAADDPPPPSTSPPLDPAAVTTSVELTRTRTQLEVNERRAAVVDVKLSAARRAVVDNDSKVVIVDQQIAVVKSRLRSRAVVAYTRGQNAGSSLLDVSASADLNSARQYAESAFGVDDRSLADLEQHRTQLADEGTGLARQRDDLLDQSAKLAGDHQRLVSVQEADQRQLDSWGAVPVMGDAWLTADQIAGWYASTGAVPKLSPGTTVSDLAQLYLVEGAAEHVRGDLAFAQAIVETGSFSVAAGNNFSGIGVCDSCRGGYAFPTPIEGVRAQIQLLRNYADPDSKAATLANPPSPALYGPDVQKSSTLYDTFFLKGKAPLWNVMGNGNWATDPKYAGKVIGVFVQMLAYASSHPT
jgi:hypothetical protein